MGPNTALKRQTSYGLACVEDVSFLGRLCFVLLCFALFLFFETGGHTVAQVGLEFMVTPLPQLPEHLGLEPQAMVFSKTVSNVIFFICP